MQDVRQATEHTVEVGRKKIAEQRERIARQRMLVERLQANGEHGALSHQASALLTELVKTLDAMLASQRAAEQRLVQEAEALDER